MPSADNLIFPGSASGISMFDQLLNSSPTKSWSEFLLETKESKFNCVKLNSASNLGVSSIANSISPVAPISAIFTSISSNLNKRGEPTTLAFSS